MSKDKSKRKYQLSFSTGGLFYNESLVTVEEYIQTGDWQVTRDSVVQKNLIQSRTESSAKRRAREICQRLQRLTSDQISLLQNGSRQEQQYLLWTAICKHYLLIYEFAVDIIYEKYLRMDLMCTTEDFIQFFNPKADWHDELDELKYSTRAKITQVIFKMLRDAELLSESNIIIPALLTPDLIKVISEDDQELLKIFPYHFNK